MTRPRSSLQASSLQASSLQASSLQASPRAPQARALLLGRPSASDPEGHFPELMNLCTGLQIQVAGRFVVKRGRGEIVLGKGKREELVEAFSELRAGGKGEPLCLVVDGPLRPNQQRQLAKDLEAEVLDRTAVILRVFAERARTHTSKLAVELAQLAYELPRVRDDESLADSEGGGGGRAERGHTNIELRKQRIRARMAEIEKALGIAQVMHEGQRERRKDAAAVALVGYTNAGKSSLMRALTGADVGVENKLFATLGTTVRAIAGLPAPRILASDTVGFIKDLPIELVASFRSTLDEALTADLLINVVDAADDAWREQLAVTRETLTAIGAGTIPALVVFNKIDRARPERRAEIVAAEPEAICVSALEESDVRRLRGAIVAFFDQFLVDAAIRVPSGDGQWQRDVRTHARIVSERYDETGDALLVVRAAGVDLERWAHALTTQKPLDTPAAVVARANEYGLAVSTDAVAFEETGLDFRVVDARELGEVTQAPAAGSAEAQRWILRTPRRPEVFASSRTEARVLRLLAPRLAAPRVSVAIPQWRVHARELIAYPRLAGTPAVTMTAEGPRWNIIDPSAPPGAFITSFARALAELQSVSLTAARLAAIPEKSIEALRSELAVTMVDVRELLAVPDALWERWQSWLADDALWPDHLALVHGDLHPGHMLLADDGRLTGILDWTEAAISDPSIDLAMFYGCFGAAALERLLVAFAEQGGRVTPTLAQHAAARWSAFPAQLAAWGVRTNNEGVVAYARSLLPTTG